MSLKTICSSVWLSRLLLIALFCNTAVAPALDAQELRRERRAMTPAAAVVAPAPRPSPTPNAAPRVVAPAPLATSQTVPTPTPTPAVVATLPARAAPQNVEELRARIREVLDNPLLAPAQFGIKVASLDTGRVLFEENAGKRLMPASNMKLYTIAAALDRLGPDFRFVTSVYSSERPDAKGHIRGDLIVYGRGDPTFSTRFNGGDYFKAIDELAAKIAAAGVKEVDGNLVGDESYFTGPPLGAGWEWDDLQWYYGAPVSALTVNDNAIDLFVKPGKEVGDKAIVITGPSFASFPTVVDRPVSEILEGSRYVSVVGLAVLQARITGSPFIYNFATTAPRGAKREITVHRPIGQSVIEVGGSLPMDDPGYSGSVAVPHPAILFVSMLRASLERQGVKIKQDAKFKYAGTITTVEAKIREVSPLAPAKLIEIARRESPPFSEVAAQTAKPSQNLYTELILRTLGKQFPGTDPKLTTAEAGTEVVKAFLREAGVNAERLALVDGSGLARSNLVTAEATLQLLTYMSHHRYAQIFRDAQPVAGMDGTLRNRMKGTPAAGNVRAKTGTLNNVAALSGYVTSAAGERLVFSMMINHYPEDESQRRTYLDQIAVLLASFAGRS